MKVFENNISKSNNLSDLCSEFFILILQLKATNDYGDAAILRTKVVDLLDNFERHSLSKGIDRTSIEYSKFALVAFIDETIIGSDWDNKSIWLAEPLQLKLFNCFNAGEEFYTRIEQLRERERENISVLEIYFLCLSLGYRGKYRLEDPEKVRIIIDELHYILNKYYGKSTNIISPNAYPKNEISIVTKEKIPIWIYAVGALSVSLIIYIILSILISQYANEVIKIIN